jgi:hypothetical protein
VSRAGRLCVALLVAMFFIGGCGGRTPEDGGQATILIPPTCIDAEAGARDADRASQANDDAVAAIKALDFDTGIAKLREAANAWRLVARAASADPAVVRIRPPPAPSSLAS